MTFVSFCQFVCVCVSPCAHCMTDVGATMKARVAGGKQSLERIPQIYRTLKVE